MEIKIEISKKEYESIKELTRHMKKDDESWTKKKVARVCFVLGLYGQLEQMEDEIANDRRIK